MPPGLTAELVVVFDPAAGAAAPGRRTADVAVPIGRFTAEVPSGLVPLAGLFARDFGELVSPVPAVPAVSSPERMDSSC